GPRSCRVKGHIRPLVRVDPHLAHLAAPQLGHLPRFRHAEGRAPEGMLHPRGTDLVEEHADAQLFDGDLLEHDDSSGQRLAAPAILATPRSRKTENRKAIRGQFHCFAVFATFEYSAGLPIRRAYGLRKAPACSPPAPAPRINTS